MAISTPYPQKNPNSQNFQQEEASIQRFRRALRKADQQSLDELFGFAHQHTAEAGYAAHLSPLEIFLLAMLLEEHKKVAKLKAKVEMLINKAPE